MRVQIPSNPSARRPKLLNPKSPKALELYSPKPPASESISTFQPGGPEPLGPRARGVLSEELGIDVSLEVLARSLLLRNPPKPHSFRGLEALGIGVPAYRLVRTDV